ARRRHMHRSKISQSCFDAASPVWAGLATIPSFGASTILGSRIVKLEPRPGSLSTVMSPPIVWQKRRLMTRPSPVPPYLLAVVEDAWENSWNNLPICSGVIPMPVSVTASVCWRIRPRPESIGSSGKIQASRGRGLVAVTGRQGRSASLPAAARDVHVPVRPARRRTGAGRPRRGELAAALRALVFGPPALLAAAAGADRLARPRVKDVGRFPPPQWLLRPPQPAHRHHPAGARRHLCPLHGGALRPDHGAAP